jgi:hypothetical protein
MLSDYTTHTTRKEFGKIIDPLDANKVTGYDQVSVRTIKARKHELIPYLVHYINCNMNSGIYPDCLKLAKVRPLHKSGNKRHVWSKNLRESHLPQIVDIYQQAWIIV